MTDAFILSQIKYYKSLIPRGNARDSHAVVGLYQHYQREANKRALKQP